MASDTIRSEGDTTDRVVSSNGETRNVKLKPTQNSSNEQKQVSY